MHLNVKLELVEDGQHVAFVEHGEQLNGEHGFFTEEGYQRVLGAFTAALAGAQVRFLTQLAAERVLAGEVTDDLLGSAA